MLINKIAIHGGEIASKSVIETEALDPTRLHKAYATLQELKKARGPLPIAGHEGDEVLIGLGRPPYDPNILKRLTKKQIDSLQKSAEENRVGMRRTHFYLTYSSSSQQYQIIPEGTQEFDRSLEPRITGSYGAVHAENYYKNRSAFPPKEVLKKQFEEVAKTIWASRPVFVTFTSLGPTWDEYCEYFAAAMMLALVEAPHSPECGTTNLF